MTIYCNKRWVNVVSLSVSPHSVERLGQAMINARPGEGADGMRFHRDTAQNGTWRKTYECLFPELSMPYFQAAADRR